MAFAIVDMESGAVAGSTRYLDISREHRKLEIGWTFLAPQFWRTHVNTEAKFLLLQYAFEEWDAQRVQLKAEAINQRSHEAILRIGAVHEGNLRSFRIRGDGQIRDVAFYSIIAPEWPAVKARLIRLLDRIPDSREAV
jgi:RimJ/RimL family protein N-acetyltransferase